MSDETTTPEKVKKQKAPKAAKQPKVRVPRGPRPVSPLVIGTFGEGNVFTPSNVQPENACTMLHEVAAWANNPACPLPEGDYGLIRVPTNAAGERIHIRIGESKVRAVKVG